MDALNQRLEILGSSGLLSPAGVSQANALRGLFLGRYGIVLSEENAAAFFTHFCMALHRQEVGEVIAPIDCNIFDEIQDQYDFENAEFILDDMERFVAVLPPWERGYLLTHLVVVLGNVRKAYDQAVLSGEA